MAEGELKFPKSFENKDAFRSFAETKVEEAFQAFFVGISLTAEQKAAVSAFGQWCTVKLGPGMFKAQSKRALEKWNLDIKRQHKEITNRRIEWHLKSIETASQDKNRG